MVPLMPSICAWKHQQNLGDEEYPWWGKVRDKLLSGSHDNADVCLWIEKGGEKSGRIERGQLEWNR